MGYYIETPAVHGKAQWLVENYDAEVLESAPEFADVPEEQALVLVIFETATLVCDKRECDAFTCNPDDDRPKTWLLMDRMTVELLSGFSNRTGLSNYRVYDPETVKRTVAAVKAGVEVSEEEGETVTPEDSRSVG